MDGPSRVGGWQELGGFQLERLDFRSRFKAVFGPTKLYVAMDTELPEGLEVKPTGFESDVRYLENAEMFIDPTGTKERYYRLIWTPAKDSCWDSRFGLIDNPLDPFYMKQDSRWHAWRGPNRWTYRAEVKGRRWRTMCEVPYALIDAKRPAKGDVWAFNAGRCSYQHLRQNSWQWALWSPNLTDRDRCNRDAFGYLEAE